MDRHFVRRAWLLGPLAATLFLAAVGTASVGLAQSAAPAGSGAVVEPWRTIPSGTCDPLFEDLCSDVAVAQWRGTPYTPPVDCGLFDCQLLMDISAPTTGGPWPIVVYLPGGPSDPSELYRDVLEPFAAALAGQGAVVMISSWREAELYGGGYPTSFADVACAIGVARQTGPAYGGDADRVILGGHSTGGWPPPVLGLTPTPFAPQPGACDQTAGSLRPDAVVVSDGVIDQVTGQEDGHNYVVRFLGGEQATRPDAWAAADPFALVKRYPAGADAIPFLLIHGADDYLVLPKVSEDFQAALVAAGYDSRLLMIPKTGHVGALTKRVTIEAIMDIATAR